MKKSFIDELILGDHPMTLREYYAGQAMQGLISSNKEEQCPKCVAETSVRLADSLIAELEGGE